MLHEMANAARILCGRPTKEKPPKERWVDIFADPGGDWSHNQKLNEEAKHQDENESS
jgi:hypothetical protein